jgi:hypothetical protein
MTVASSAGMQGRGKNCVRLENSDLLALSVGETRSGPISNNLLRRRDLLRRTGKIVLEFSGPAGDMNLDGFQAAVLHPQAELFVDFLDAVLLQAIAHARASARNG